MPVRKRRATGKTMTGNGPKIQLIKKVLRDSKVISGIATAVAKNTSGRTSKIAGFVQRQASQRGYGLKLAGQGKKKRRVRKKR